MTRLGQMRHKIEIQVQSAVTDEGGGQTLTWTALASPFAKIKPLSGSEAITAGAMSAPFTHEVTIHHRSDVQPQTHRVLWNGTLLNIRSIANVDQKEAFLTLRCEEGVLT